MEGDTYWLSVGTRVGLKVNLHVAYLASRYSKLFKFSVSPLPYL